jgi:GDP-L-fucose synthase
MKEEYLLTGELESTNEPYALAKIAGIKMCESYYRQYGCQFFSVMPTNTYGPNDNYDLDTSHALPALIRKIQEAKVSNARKVTVWGSGKPLREFIHVDDIADACVFIMGLDFRELYEQGLTHLNVGTGNEITIRELAELISGIVGFSGDFIFDQSMPDGTPRKLLDVSRINELGWRHQISLEEGIKALCGWYMENFQPFENKTYSKTLAS